MEKLEMMPEKPPNNSAARRRLLASLLVGLLAAAVAFLPRAWRLPEIQYQFDDWLGAFHPAPVPDISDGLGAVIWQIHESSRYYMASTMTITYNVICQAIKLFTGHDFTAMRWWFAAAFALGVGLTGFIAARLWGPWTAPTWSTILLGSFSITSIVFSQFANNFSFTPILTAAQVGIYLWQVRGKWGWPGFLLLAVVAYIAQLVMYTQFLVTAGILVAAFVEISLSAGGWRRYASWFFSGLTYCVLSFIHFYATFLLIPRDEPFRWYMYRYYPVFLLEKGVPGTAWDGSWFGYYLVRLYDFLNYHWSLVFHPRIYMPLEWSWASLPFLLVLLGAVVCWFAGAYGKRGKRNRLSVISNQETTKNGSSERSGDPDSRSSGRITDHRSEAEIPIVVHRDGSRITDHGSRFFLSGTGLPLVIIATVACHLLANRTLFITFGGTRQTVYLAALMWLGYGSAAASVLDFWKRRSWPLRRAAAGILAALTVVPFALSLPGFYRDRVTRVELDAIIAAIEEYRPERILAGRDSIQAIQLTMMSDPRFSGVHWPGHPYESEVLDLDLVEDRPRVAFTLGGRGYEMEWVETENFPREGDNMLYLDTFLAHDARHEGPELLKFYAPLDRMISARQRVIPLVERPGNVPDAVHQSIYWPPNAFYMYRVVKQ